MTPRRPNQQTSTAFTTVRLGDEMSHESLNALKRRHQRPIRLATVQPEAVGVTCYPQWRHAWPTGSSYGDRQREAKRLAVAQQVGPRRRVCQSALCLVRCDVTVVERTRSQVVVGNVWLNHAVTHRRRWTLSTDLACSSGVLSVLWVQLVVYRDFLGSWRHWCSRCLIVSWFSRGVGHCTSKWRNNCDQLRRTVSHRSCQQRNICDAPILLTHEYAVSMSRQRWDIVDSQPDSAEHSYTIWYDKRVLRELKSGVCGQPNLHSTHNPKQKYIYHVGRKKVSGKLLCIYSPNIDRFSKNNFTGTFCGKFAIKWSLKIPPHPNGVVKYNVPVRVRRYVILVNAHTYNWRCWCIAGNMLLLILQKRSRQSSISTSLPSTKLQFNTTQQQIAFFIQQVSPICCWMSVWVD